MKTFTTFISENQSEVQSFLNDLKEKVKTTLGDQFVVNGFISTLGGADRPSIAIEVYGKNPVNGIKQNSGAWMIFWMHDINKPVKSFESDTVARHFKFRKINAKTLDDAVNKLVAFFKKSKQKMIDVDSGALDKFTGNPK